MSTAAIPSHQSYAVAPNDLELLDLITSLPTRSSVSSPSTSYGTLHGHGDAQSKKRPLATLQALRRPPIDPIILAASLSSGPHVTRHHFHHSFGSKVGSKQMRRTEREEQQRLEEQQARSKTASESAKKPPVRHRAGSYANCDVEGEHEELARELNEAVYSQMPRPSKQMPRSERLRLEKEAKEQVERAKAALEKAERERAESKLKQPDPASLDRPKLSREPTAQIEEELHNRKEAIRTRQVSSSQKNASLVETGGSHAVNAAQHDAAVLPAPASMPSIVRPPPLHVRCYARTRIPTPHGEILCHLYRNNRDSKEHLAFVVDPAQNQVGGDWERGEVGPSSKDIRSRTLDEVWGPQETEMERIVRGAYVGRLGPSFQKASEPSARGNRSNSREETSEGEAPLVRIHSECFTGETIGSQRCDCGEQLDEAIRLIHATSPTRGVVVYLRQEGRGIGLLDKLMAYNLQDMGHDTVSANILLGHLADARRYDIAAEILRDLGINECKLLTNNPEKMESLEREGVEVTSRVAMVPRVWRISHHKKHQHHRHGSHSRRKTKEKSSKMRSSNLASSVLSQFSSNTHSDGEGNHDDQVSDADEGSESDSSRDSYVDHIMRKSGATMLGGSVTRGPELEKYLRTKVERMGHMLDLPASEGESTKPSKAATTGEGSAQEAQYVGRAQSPDHVHLSGHEDEELASLMGESELGQFTTDNQHTGDEADEDEILIHHQQQQR